MMSAAMQAAKKKRTRKRDEVEEIGIAPPDISDAVAQSSTDIAEVKESRTPSPFQKNKNAVAPLDADDVSQNNVSVRSTTSIKEAWPDENNEGAAREDSNKTDTEKEIENKQQHAYVPYLYARDSVARVVADMEAMKSRHLYIVHSIEDNYRLIEQETQSQFNAFILLLRQQYGQKVEICQQTIESHRLELSQKEARWKQILSSWSKRNKQLLKEKNALLARTKLEIDSLENEKSDQPLAASTPVTSGGTGEVPKSQSPVLIAAGVAVKQDREDLDRLNAENIRLTNELSAERNRVAALELQLGQSPVADADKTSDQIIADKEETLMAAPGVGLADIGQDKQKIIIEREAIQAEQDRLGTELEALTAERAMFAAERERIQDENTRLQMALVEGSKETAELKAKYDILTNQMKDYLALQAGYRMLQDQYKVVAMVASKTTDQSKDFIEQELKSVSVDEKAVSQEKDQLDGQLRKWEKNFEKKNGRTPVADDRDLSVAEKYSQSVEAGVMLDSLSAKRSVLACLEKGEVPPVPTPPVMSLTPPFPVVTTIEVKVPDPEVQYALEKCQKDLNSLSDQLDDCRRDNLALRADTARLNGEVTDKEVEVRELQGRMEEMKLEGGVILASDPLAVQKLGEAKKELRECQLEVEKMKIERKEMHRDIKKMLRKEVKIQEQIKAGDTETTKFLEIIAEQSKQIYGVVPAASVEANGRLDERTTELSPLDADRKTSEKAVRSWEKKYKKANGKDPLLEDRDDDANQLYESVALANQKARDKRRVVNALQLLTTGTLPAMAEIKGQPEKQIATSDDVTIDKLDDQISDLEVENKSLKEEKDDLNQKLKEMEQKLLAIESEGPAGDMQAAVTMETGSAEDIAVLEKKVASLEADITQEVAAHEHTREELETVERQLSAVTAEMDVQKTELEAKIANDLKASEEIVKTQQERLDSHEKRIAELENEQLRDVPLDAAAEIRELRAAKNSLEKEKTQNSVASVALASQINELQMKLDLSTKSLANQKQALSQAEGKLKSTQAEKSQVIKEWSAKVEKKERDLSKEKQNVANLERRLKKLEEASLVGGKGGDKVLKEQLMSLRRENTELNEKLRRSDAELKTAQKSDAGDAAAERLQMKRNEKILKELEKKYDMEKRKTAKQEENLKQQEEEIKMLKKDHGTAGKELATLQQEMAVLSVAAKEGVEAAAKVKQLESEVKTLTNENKILTENYNSERVLRKKYYNMVEDMKGKIRVFCRARPLVTSEIARGNTSVVKSPDEYTIHIESSRGPKEYQFDSIFMPDSSQERVFEDTNNLIQSAVDGYNVCIFAYGQTGSGKTFTMIGDSSGKNPGIAPRAFTRIFEVLQQNSTKFSFQVSTYMLELYNDQLIDLYSTSGHQDHEKLEIRKDKKGLVFVQGAQMKSASNSKELYALFQEGSTNRHTAATQMNSESSRSHLVIAVIIESTNLSTGQVLKGKLSLVDLAGSERAAKTGSSAEQLKEAMSINKSLSALGDVISALSSEQTFIPYRNNKLTMLMQDSLGGNAKTLMFVNISPADYNMDESVISLTYASRVKLITNDATKNADNKEIARLKSVIAKLRAGEQVDVQDEDQEEDET